jgi:uncharacterized protein YoxC
MGLRFMAWDDCDFDDDKYDSWLSRIEHKIDAIVKTLGVIVPAIQKEGKQLMSLADDIAKLTADVAAETSTVDSVVALLSGLSDTIKQLQGQITDPTSISALEDLINQIEANQNKLANAVTANTPTPAAGARRK